jgi:hypothetical protein
VDNIRELQAITSRVVGGYVTRSLNAKLYHIHDEANRIDSVVVVPHKRSQVPHVMVMTRIEGDRVIVEADTTDRPLDDALVAAGVPRSRIVLAYADEAASLA